MTVTMIDGINLDVPAILARWGPSTPVACYVNGIYAWTHGQEAQFARKVRVSVMPGQPDAAKVARVLDVEPGAARPEDVPPFLRVRAGIGDDGTVYCNLATVPAVLAQLPDGDVNMVPRWWLAWYWGNRFPPTWGQVLAELHDLTGVVLASDKLWGCQWRSTGSWDQSVVYGAQDWSR